MRFPSFPCSWFSTLNGPLKVSCVIFFHLDFFFIFFPPGMLILSAFLPANFLFSSISFLWRYLWSSIPSLQPFRSISLSHLATQADGTRAPRSITNQEIRSKSLRFQIYRNLSCRIWIVYDKRHTLNDMHGCEYQLIWICECKGVQRVIASTINMKCHTILDYSTSLLAFSFSFFFFYKEFIIFLLVRKIVFS